MILKTLSKQFFIFLFLSVFCHKIAFSQIFDSSFYGWDIYEIQESELDYKKCYIISNPIQSDTSHSSRKKPFVMIARYEKDRSEELSIYSGFEYKLNSEVLTLIDDTNFSLVTEGDMAWAKTRVEDAIIIQKLLQSAILKVRSNSSVATYGVDIYSLKGLVKAYTRMRTICP